MKGKILVSILALGASSMVLANGGLAPAPVAPDYFSGFVAGLDGSMQHLSGHAQDKVVYGASTYNTTRSSMPRGLLGSNENDIYTDVGDNTPGIGAFVGYGKVFNTSFYLGGEAYARYANNSSDENTYNDLNFSGISSQGNIAGFGKLHTSMNIDTNWSYGAALKLGYLLTPRTMLYLLAGIEYSKFEVDVNHSFPNITMAGGQGVGTLPGWSDGYSFDQKKVVFVPGVGIETMITDKLSLKAEYTYADYGQFSHGNSNVSGPMAVSGAKLSVNSVIYGTESQDKVDLKRGLYTLGLSYHFNGI